MSRSTYTMFIGVFSAALNFIMFIFTFLVLVGFTVVEKFVENSSEENSTTEPDDAEAYAGFSMLLLFLLAHFIFSFIISMLMVVGVKKENHRYLAPWVFLTMFGLIFQTFVIFTSLGKDKDDEEKSDAHTFAVVLSTVIMAALWYPVYRHYKSLKHCKSATVEACTNSTPAVCVAPTYVYNAPADYCHANAKYVPVAAPQEPHVMYPSVSEC